MASNQTFDFYSIENFPPFQKEVQSLIKGSDPSKKGDIEYELRIGKVRKNVFEPGVSKEEFMKVKTFLDSNYPIYKGAPTPRSRNPETKEKITYYNTGKRHLEFIEGERPFAPVTDRKDREGYPYDISLGPYTIRTTLARENPDRITQYDRPDRVKVRIDNTYNNHEKSYSIYMRETIPDGPYEIEIELDPKYVGSITNNVRDRDNFYYPVKEVMSLITQPSKAFDFNKIKSNYNLLVAGDKFNKNILFPIKQPVNLLRDKLFYLNKYIVMPKYDGVRYFLFFDKMSKSAYLVNGFDIFYVGSFNNDYLNNLILDGEWINDKYYAFDVFAGPNGINSKDLPYTERRKIVDSAVKIFSNSKVLVFPSWDNLAEGILYLAENTELPTDGLIFTAKEQGYYGTNYKYKPTSLLTVDFHVSPKGDLQNYDNAGRFVNFMGAAGSKYSGRKFTELKSGIYEFKWNPELKDFVMVRARPDKTKPNHVNVAYNIWTDINNPISEAEFLEYIQRFSGKTYTEEEKQKILRYLGVDKIETNFIAPRDERFRMMIFNTLKLANLKDKVIHKIIDDPIIMEKYGYAFTSPEVDPEHNFELYETLGDSTVNQAFVTDILNRYPKLDTPDGVKIISRVKLSLTSSASFAKIADGLGFFAFISAPFGERIVKKNKLLEDVFEAFFGVTCEIFDVELKESVGYSVSYSIISNVMKNVPISLKYEDLFDPNTRLKEIFDYFKPKSNRDKILDGKLTYTTSLASGPEKKLGNLYVVKAIFVNSDGKEEVLGEATGPNKQLTQRKSSEKGIEYLARKGFIRPIPELYKNL